MKRQLHEVAKRKRGEDSFPYSLPLPMSLFSRTEFDSRKKAAAINTAATFGFRLVRKTCYFLLRHAVKAIPERFEPPLGLVPFVFMRCGYRRAFSVPAALGVFQTPNHLFVTSFRIRKWGGRREFFQRKNRLLGATAPSLPCRLQPAYFLEQRRFNAKVIAIAPKIAA